MGCATCSQGNNQGSGGSGCCDLRAMDVVTPLNDIRNGDENFCFSEITDKICENLKNDEGINPSATHSNSDCDDLSSLNDLATGSLHNALMTLNLCDVDAYKCWLDSLLSWQWNVDKALICAICGLWNVVHCLDGKTRNSIRLNKLWEGEKNIFDLPSFTLSDSIENYDSINIYTTIGTESHVDSFNLKNSSGTILYTDKVGGNNKYQMADASIAYKELGIQFDNDKSMKINHFTWTIMGMYPFTGNVAQQAKYLILETTDDAIDYNNSQSVEFDKTHKITMIEGIISHDTGSCIGK